MGRISRLHSWEINFFSLNYCPKWSKIAFRMRNYAIMHGVRNKIVVNCSLQDGGASHEQEECVSFIRRKIFRA